MMELMFSRRDLARIIIPLVVEQVLLVLVGMVDSVMVSSVGEAAISGVSLVDTVNILMIYILSALAAGGAVVISQFLGGGETEKAQKSAKQLLWVVFFVALVIMALVLIFRKPLLSLVFGSVEQRVMQNAQVYFLYTALSYPFLGVAGGASAVFRAMRNSKISMYASIVMNGINVAGNALLIFGFHMGVAGAAIATLISRVVNAVMMVAALHSKKNIIHVEKLWRFKPDPSIIKRICGIGIPNGLENGMFQFGKILTQSLIATFSTAHIAANAVASTLSTFQYMPGNAIGLALVTIVGQCVGAGEKAQAKRYTRNLLGIAYAMIAAVSVLLCLFADQIIGFYQLGPEAAGVAKSLIFVHSLAVSLMHPSAFAITNAFRASSDVRYPMVLSIISMWVFRVGFGYLFAATTELGVMSVWYAMFCDWIFRACFYVTRFSRGTWLTKYRTESIKGEKKHGVS